MRVVLTLLFLLIHSSLRAQDYYATLEKNMLTLYDEKKYSESLQLSTQYLRVFPDNLTANGNQAACLLFLNRPTEALTYIDRVLLMDPTSAASITAKAYVLAQQGNVSEAKKLLTEAIRLSPENEDSQVAIEEMKEFGKVFNKQEVFHKL
ncbi:MAG: tetratricopeptide repeat protein, partial [Cyclobacteriaceae bacterium]